MQFVWYGFEPTNRLHIKYTRVLNKGRLFYSNEVIKEIIKIFHINAQEFKNLISE